MGYSYVGRQLCCDVCGDYGHTRKYRCPFGYCPAIALCPKCKREHPEYTSKEGHRKVGCEKAMIKATSHENERKSLLEAGYFVRCSALWHPTRNSTLNVKVIFRGINNEEAYWMTDATYKCIPLLANATPSDFENYGTLRKALNTELYDIEQIEKEVVNL
jgi:hypothetical protein